MAVLNFSCIISTLKYMSGAHTFNQHLVVSFIKYLSYWLAPRGFLYSRVPTDFTRTH